DALTESDSVARRVTAGVVVEVREDVHPLCGARGEPVGPIIEAIVRIAPAVLLGAEMESNVHERTDHQLAAGGTLHVMKAERHVVAPHELEDALVVPARLAELDGVAISARQGAQEDFEPVEAARPARRQLIQDWPEPRS